MKNKSYILDFEYGNRTSYRPFLIQLMNKFDKDSLVGIAFFVNNNPYNLEFLLFLQFKENDDLFEAWLKNSYPEYNHKFVFNYHLNDLIKNQKDYKRYNLVTIVNQDDLDMILTKNKNHLFNFPEEKTLSQIFGKQTDSKVFEVFLSHSSLDKKLIDLIFFELQKVEIKIWYDKFEIDFGDSISDKINEGLDKSDLGLICMSKNFLESNWGKGELNYFLQKRMNTGNPNFIVLNIDCEHEDIPPLIQDYRYLSLQKQEWKKELLNTISKKILQKKKKYNK